MSNQNQIPQEAIEELTESFGVAVAIIISALAREYKELDAERMRHALSVQIQIAKTRDKIPDRAIEIANFSLMAVESVCMNNEKEKAENLNNKH